jgi:hypothetical protein
VPIRGVIRPGWRELVVEHDKKGRQRVNRISYELFVLEAVRERVRCKEVWVNGADRYRNPDDDLPADFPAPPRSVLPGPGSTTRGRCFIGGLQQEMAEALAMLDRGLPTNPDVRLVLRSNGKNAIRLSPSRRCPIHPISSVSSWNSVVGGQRPACSTCSRKSTCASVSLSSS